MAGVRETRGRSVRVARATSVDVNALKMRRRSLCTVRCSRTLSDSEADHAGSLAPILMLKQVTDVTPPSDSQQHH